MRSAFTLIEIVISLMIMAMMSGIFMLNISTVEKQTANKEAERLAHWISGKIVQANNTGNNLYLVVNQNDAKIYWNQFVRIGDTYTASKGCTFSWNINNRTNSIQYATAEGRFYQGATITVTGEGDPYYVIIATLGSRVRVSSSSASD